MTDQPTLSDFTAVSATDEFRALHLFERMCIADQFLPMVQSQYRVVFEDPDTPDATCGVLVPDPHWMAQALHGNILPPIEAELEDQATYQTYLANGGDPAKFNWHDVDGGAKHPYAAPIGPMTEEQAIEYLIMKCLPQRVWKSNQPRFAICPVDMIPTIRTFRNAWRLAA
jgi:hypothetical protein